MTLNLSRFTFDPQHGTTLRLLGDPYELHRFVYAVMCARGEPGRLLYRLDSGIDLRDPRPRLLVQTEYAVEADVLRYSSRADFVRIESKSVDVSFKPEKPYRFRARVNPVRSIPATERGVRGKRVGVYRPEEQIEWFRKRLAACGMALYSVDHRREPWMEVLKRNAGARKRLIFASALFEGTLRIVDADIAGRAIVDGIGPGKGFGFGLLSLSRM